MDQSKLQQGRKTSNAKRVKPHTIRIDGEGNTKTVNVSATKAIVLHCIECMGFQPSMVEGCTAELCPLYLFRTTKVRQGRV